MIEMKEVSKIYGKDANRLYALNHLSLQIADGDFVVILGASGSGKSTLLHVMSGLEKPDHGRIAYDGVEISGFNEKELTEFRKNNVGFIFQQYYLLPHLTVEKNVRMGADLAGNRDYREVIEAVGLGDKTKKYPSELSGGEQQRAAIARALAKKPKALFLDEPTGVLDEQTGRQVLAYIAKLHRQCGFTLVMVTHNQNIAEMAGTVIKMNSGTITETVKNAVRKSAYEIAW